MTLKNNNFSIFLGFFPCNSKNKGERQKWISDSDSTSKSTSIKRKKNILFYMTLNNNNTNVLGSHLSSNLITTSKIDSVILHFS